MHNLGKVVQYVVTDIRYTQVIRRKGVSVDVMFGYTVQKGRKVLEVDTEKAIVVRRLFELRHFFKHWSLSQLAEQLNMEGYQTEKGKRFTKVQVKCILDRESFYRGIYTYGQIQANGKHEAII